MEESKELQGFYKIFRAVIYVSILMEFFAYALEPEQLDFLGGVVTDIHTRIKRWMIYHDGNLVYSKVATFLLICITCVGTRNKKHLEFDARRQVLYPLLSGVLLIVQSVWLFGHSIMPCFYTLRLNTWLYMLTSIVGVVLVHIALDNISKFLKEGLLKDRFNFENESFEQCRELQENKYSVNIPMRYYYKGKFRKGWVNIVNPFRGTWVVGTPGSGKTFSIIEPFIRQHSEKGFAMVVYDYKFPTLDLLNQYEDNGPNIDMEEQNANKDRIIKVLRSFGIEISSIKASVGPTITLYEITPAEGVRISKIRNLEDDIALSLSALGIRIIAPIPGKGTIGIEVPNANPRIVPMQSILNSKKFQETTMELPIALGKTITNEVFMVDLAKAPHMLVAGATGQGKSVGLNAIVTSLLYKKHPAELKFVIVDPKKVEFSVYTPIERHFLAKLPDGEDAIITDVSKVVQTLNSLCIEMDTRYDLLRKAGCRNIKEYNAKFISRQLNPEKGHRFMPYIVIIIDEFGDLIMTAGKEVELPICRIAQLARAVGIHAIIATQRPTTNIITGTIKANFPARVAFRVAAMMDSRTILDRSGAQQLIGKGDMLYLQGNDPVRVQCAFVDTPEVERIANYISKQQGYPTAFMLPEYVGEESESSIGEVDMNRLDPMFEDAARLVVIHQQGSTSLIQRKFSIGYNRAGRIMDQLEKAGIVGPTQGSKARDVLCMDETDLEMKLNNLQQ